MIRVLQLAYTLSAGGAEGMLMRIYRGIDRNALQFDFLTVTDQEEAYTREVERLCGMVHCLPKRSEDLLGYTIGLYRMVRKNQYKMAHIHNDNAFFALLDAWVLKAAGCKKILAFAHSTCDWRNGFFLFLHKLARPLLNRTILQGFACGADAARWLYGKRAYRAIILPLPIESAAYRYSRQRRDQVREAMGIPLEDTVYIHVGSVIPLKNHAFVLRVFHGLKRKDARARLLLAAGVGEMTDELKNRIAEYGLEDSVTFLGRIDDVCDKMIASDALLFPSLWEGFPTVVLEAQASGLPCFLSDRITADIALTDLVRFLPIDGSAEPWIRAISETRMGSAPRETYNAIIAEKYDTKNVAQSLSAFYTRVSAE